MKKSASAGVLPGLYNSGAAGVDGLSRSPDRSNPGGLHRRVTAGSIDPGLASDRIGARLLRDRGPGSMPMTLAFLPRLLMLVVISAVVELPYRRPASAA